jgi:hypothetical protein
MASAKKIDHPVLAPGVLSQWTLGNVFNPVAHGSTVLQKVLSRDVAGFGKVLLACRNSGFTKWHNGYLPRAA